MPTDLDTEIIPPTTKPVTTDLLRVLGPAYFNGSTYFTDISFPNGQGVMRAYNIRDYGAVGDASTDDTTAIQNCINDAQNAFYGMVVFPPGTYKITSALTITKSIALLGLGANVDNIHNYTTDAGTTNVNTGGVAIYQTTAAANGFTVRQTSTYRIVFYMNNIAVWGPQTGAAAQGIVVNSTDLGENIQCIWKNVRVFGFQGYGIYLQEGYYSSTFEDIYSDGNGLSGIYAIGTSQGECSLKNIRCFGNGSLGATEADASGIYWNSGGSGNSFIRISCTSNYKAQFYIKGSSATLLDFQAESFNANNSADRSLVVDGCSIFAAGLYLSPQSSFLGKIIDLRTCVNSQFFSIHFLTSVNAAGYHIYEDGSSGSNEFQVNSISGTLVTNLNSGTTYGGGNAQNILVMGNPGAALTQTIAVTTPATTSRIWTIPDISGNATFAALEAAQTFSGANTFSTAVTITPTSNQLILGTTRTATITAPTPASSSRTYTFPDQGSNYNVVADAGSQTIAGSKTFSSGVTINPTTNQLILGATRTATITAPTPASSSRTYTFPDLTTDYSVVGDAGTQTISGAKTFSATLTMSGATIAMGSQKITGLANGTSATDAAAFGQLKVLQTVTATSTTNFTTTANTFQATNLAATITPTSSSSRIIILINSQIKNPAMATVGYYITIDRSGTNLGTANGFAIFQSSTGTIGIQMPFSMFYDDSPATTSARTYTVKIRNDDNATTMSFGLNGLTQSMDLIEVQ